MTIRALRSSLPEEDLLPEVGDIESLEGGRGEDLATWAAGEEGCCSGEPGTCFLRFGSTVT
jgi:hypothetical protein